MTKIRQVKCDYVLCDKVAPMVFDNFRGTSRGRWIPPNGWIQSQRSDDEHFCSKVCHGKQIVYEGNLILMDAGLMA